MGASQPTTSYCWPLSLQAAYRGHRGRTVYRRLLAERQEQRAAQAAREAAALAVIAPWTETFKARVWFLRARRAAPVLQAWWRCQYVRRQAAATAIQASVRCLLARRYLQRSREAALWVQTAWRGFRVRESHPKHKQLADIRTRLRAAAINAGAAITLQPWLPMRVQSKRAALHDRSSPAPSPLQPTRRTGRWAHAHAPTWTPCWPASTRPRWVLRLIQCCVS